MAELGECSPPPTKSNANNHNAPASTHSTTTASDGGPLALGYDKINETSNADSTQNGSSSNGQALLPTPSNSGSSSDKAKTVTWIQKQGIWKQVVQDTVEPTPSNQQSNQQTTTPTTYSAATDSSTATNISTDPYALSYSYNAYLQQALTSGQDYATAMATAQAAFESYVAYTAYANNPDNSATSKHDTSKYYSQAYNAVPPTAQLGTGATVSSSNNSTISSSYGYGMMPPTSTTASNYSAYAAYYGLGAMPPQEPLPVRYVHNTHFLN